MINCSVLFVVCNFIHLVTKKVLCLSYNISLFTRMPSWVGSSIKCLIALEINISDLLAIYEGTKAIQMFATEKKINSSITNHHRKLSSQTAAFHPQHFHSSNSSGSSKFSGICFSLLSDHSQDRFYFVFSLCLTSIFLCS